MNRLDTFSTPIWMEELTDLAPHRDRLAQAVRDLRSASGQSMQHSNRNGWHSGPGLLARPEFAVLGQRLVPAIRAALADYGVQPGSLSFTVPAWANVHDRGGFNVSHVHPGSWLSGTVYLSVHPGAGRLYFNDPRPAAAMEGLPLRHDRQITPGRPGEKYFVNPRELMLVMFPSWLPHGVEQNDSEERISVAFNVTPARAPVEAPAPAANPGTERR